VEKKKNEKLVDFFGERENKNANGGKSDMR
jgi:hypothetical protein